MFVSHRLHIIPLTYINAITLITITVLCFQPPKSPTPTLTPALAHNTTPISDLTMVSGNLLALCLTFD